MLYAKKFFKSFIKRKIIFLILKIKIEQDGSYNLIILMLKNDDVLLEKKGRMSK